MLLWGSIWRWTQHHGHLSPVTQKARRWGAGGSAGANGRSGQRTKRGTHRERDYITGKAAPSRASRSGLWGRGWEEGAAPGSPQAHPTGAAAEGEARRRAGSEGAARPGPAERARGAGREAAGRAGPRREGLREGARRAGGRRLRGSPARPPLTSRAERPRPRLLGAAPNPGRPSAGRRCPRVGRRRPSEAQPRAASARPRP